MDISSLTQQIQDSFRKDPGIDGDAQRISQISWLLFLKAIDVLEKENKKKNIKYQPVLPNAISWDVWTSKFNDSQHDELVNFINDKLIPSLTKLKGNTPLSLIVKQVFMGIRNYSRSGKIIFETINYINFLVDYADSKQKHFLGDMYEKILNDLQNAGNAGEFYTPRALTDLIVCLTNPKKGNKILDFACGSGGFLISALEHLTKNNLETEPHEHGKCLLGVEKKSTPYLLCQTNLILHGVNPSLEIQHGNMLDRELGSYSQEDQVDIIVANPPFGSIEEKEIRKNFPEGFRSRDTADLFTILSIKLLKKDGCAGIILPDGFLYAGAVKERIRKTLLEECDLHTIVRLPRGVFNPYTNIATNILFFKKGHKTKKIWFYEQKTRPGIKTYSKTKPIKLNDFSELMKWWKNKIPSDVSWQIDINDIKANDYRLDIRNPYVDKKRRVQPKSSITAFLKTNNNLNERKELLTSYIFEILGSSKKIKHKFLLSNLDYLLSSTEGLEKLKMIALKIAFTGDISVTQNRVKAREQIFRMIDKENIQQDLFNSKLTGNTGDRWHYIPKHWTQVRLEEISFIVGGGTPNSRVDDYFSEKGIPWLTPADLRGLKSKYVYKGKRDLTDSGYKNSSAKIIPKGSILFSSRAPIGYVAIAGNDICTNQGFKSIVPFISDMNMFIYYFLLYEGIYIEKNSPGTTFKEVSGKQMKKVIIPLPPLEEQKIIVSKLDILISNIDELKEIYMKTDRSFANLQEDIFKYMTF